MNTTVPESKRLLVLEKIIKKGKQSFVEVGSALAEIKESKLYTIEYETFEDYCREKWGWEKRYWQYVIASAETVKSLPEPARTIVHTETQARELAQAPEENRVEVVEKASAKAEAESRPMTARDVREAREEIVIELVPKSDPPIPPKQPESQESADEKEQIRRELLIEKYAAKRSKLLSQFAADDLPIIRNWERAELAKSEAHDRESL